MGDRRGAWKSYRQEVLERIGDFSEIFAGVRKQKAGSDGWVSGCCPLHDDKTPSFAFNRRTGQWCCFSGCGKGSAFDFLMQTTGSTFRDALLALGDKAGVPRPEMNGHNPGGLSEDYVEKAVKALEANERLRKYLREKRGLTDESVRKHKLGWDAKRGRLVIPVRDEKGRLVNIRFYSPSKRPKMMNLKGYGNTPRLYGADELAAYDGKQVILCEGEFDSLILRQNGFMAVTSTHGCASFRKEWLRLLGGKDLVIGYDADAEGQGAVQGVVLRALKGSKLASAKNLRLPLEGTKQDKDFTDFFTKPRCMNGDILDKRCYTAQDLQALIDKAPPIDLSGSTPSGQPAAENNADLIAVLAAIRNSDGMKQHERQVAVSEAAADHLSSRGSFFFDPKSSEEYLCLDGQVLLMGNNRAFNALLQDIGRLNFTTSEGRFVWEYLRNYARSRGAPVQSNSWVYGDPAAPALYVHAHDDAGRILKIAPGSVGFIPNGRNAERILLNTSDRVQPFKYLADQDMAEGLRLLRNLLFDNAPCSESDRAFLMAYLPAVLMRDFCATKPLVRLSGAHGSGKTSLTAALSHILYGENVGKSSTSSANYTDASKNPLTILDNKESRDVDRDLLNFLLTASTGIVHEKRKLYENQEIIRERANAFIITNGIETLGKPELLSRQWEIVCDEKFFSREFSETEHLNCLREGRDKMFSAVIQLIAAEILPRLGRRQALDRTLAARFPDHPKRRTFGCLSLILIAWDALERILGLPKNLDSTWVLAQHEESHETSQETDIFVQFIELLRVSPAGYEQMGLQLAGEQGARYFEASSVSLHNLFAKLARDNGLPKPFDNAKQLGERLKESIPTLSREGWDVRMQARKVQGRRVHRFHLPGQKANKTENLGATS